jgi:hypothetical protein
MVRWRHLAKFTPQAPSPGSRWPALRAVGELPRSNRIRFEDQIKPMLFWRIGLAQRIRRALGARDAAMQRGTVGVAWLSCCRPDSLVAPCKFMPCCRPGKRFVKSNPLCGPHESTYGAAWPMQLPSRGTNLVSGCHPRLDHGEEDDSLHGSVDSSHLQQRVLRNIPPLGGDVEVLVAKLRHPCPAVLSTHNFSSGRNAPQPCRTRYPSAMPARNFMPLGSSYLFIVRKPPTRGQKF